MCQDFTREDEKPLGLALLLCDRFDHCLLPRFGLGDGAEESGDIQAHGPARSLFSAFAPRASLAIVEFDYFDLDYRSEFSVTHETSFIARNPSARRVHFFSTQRAPTPDERMRDFIVACTKSYLGYVIVRPQEPPTVGRSMVTANGDCQWLRFKRQLRRHIRTAVPERVNLFGVPLTAVGVPFMEQDGHLLRCAHVSAWTCHFAAVLRGSVPRRASAEFHLAEDSSAAYGRPYPSGGLTATSLSQILRRLDLPPEVIDDETLRRKRLLTWYDRPALWNAVREADSSPEKARLARQEHVWRTENLTANVCRYLNSGVPCILSRQTLRHTQVVCGYLRRQSLNAAKRRELTEHDSVSDVVAFIVQDDQEGPYRPVWVHELIKEMQPPFRSWGLSVLVPLPAGLWLSGGAAELQGAEIFAQVVKERTGQLHDWAQMHQLTASQEAEHRQVLQRLQHNVSADGSGDLAIRSFAVRGTDLKESERIADPTAQWVVGYTALPKFVWVIEVVDRTMRSQVKASVLATVVLDASAVSEKMVSRRALSPLIVHIPGQISRLVPEVFDNTNWHPTRLGPYKSGRWSHQHRRLSSPEKLWGRAKGATPVSFR